jgi:hypothetical protein
MPQGGTVGEARIMLAVVAQLRLTEVSNPVVFLPFKGKKHIIHVGIQVMLSQLIYIILIFGPDGMYRKLVGMLLFIYQRILHTPRIL